VQHWRLIDLRSVLGASQTWTAPNTPGEYTLSCAITNTLNASGTDTGSREAAATDTVSVYVPNVAITAPAQGGILTVDAPINVTASVDASAGGIALQQVVLKQNGQSIGSPISFDPTNPNQSYIASWTPTATGTYALTAVATYADGTSVTSLPVTVTAGSMSVTHGDWSPTQGVVNQLISGPVSATLSSGLDGTGTGPTFATYDWSQVTLWESNDGGVAIPFSTYGGGFGAGFVDDNKAVGMGTDNSTFYRFFTAAGYYIIEDECTATIFDSATGNSLGSVVGVDYIGGSPPLTPAIRRRSDALRPMDSPSPPPPTGTPSSTIPVAGSANVSLTMTSPTTVLPGDTIAGTAEVIGIDPNGTPFSLPNVPVTVSFNGRHFTANSDGGFKFSFNVSWPDSSGSPTVTATAGVPYSDGIPVPITVATVDIAVGTDYLLPGSQTQHGDGLVAFGSTSPCLIGPDADLPSPEDVAIVPKPTGAGVLTVTPGSIGLPANDQDPVTFHINGKKGSSSVGDVALTPKHLGVQCGPSTFVTIYWLTNATVTAVPTANPYELGGGSFEADGGMAVNQTASIDLKPDAVPACDRLNHLRLGTEQNELTQAIKLGRTITHEQWNAANPNVKIGATIDVDKGYSDSYTFPPPGAAMLDCGTISDIPFTHASTSVTLHGGHNTMTDADNPGWDNTPGNKFANPLLPINKPYIDANGNLMVTVTYDYTSGSINEKFVDWGIVTASSDDGTPSPIIYRCGPVGWQVDANTAHAGPQPATPYNPRAALSPVNSGPIANNNDVNTPGPVVQKPITYTGANF